MDLTSLLSAKESIKNLSEKKLPKKIENILLKKILIKLNALKTVANKLSVQDKTLKQNLQKLKNFKPTFRNISSLDKLLNETLENISDNSQNKSYIQKNITNIKNLIKDVDTLKTVYNMADSLKEEVALLTKDKNNLQVKNFLNKLESFLKLLYKDADTKILQSSFKEVEEAFSKMKKNLILTEHSKEILSSIKKKIDTISVKVFLKNSNSDEIKQFDAILKEILVANKSNKIKLIDKQTLIKNIGNITKNLDEISYMLPDKKKFISLKQELKNFTQDIKNINLKNNITNSGVFYEAKLANMKNINIDIDEIPKKDIKAMLLKLKNEESLQNHKPLQNILDKTINQINTVQTNALITHTVLTYIPFGWQDLKDGYFSISRLKKEKSFSCKIELDLESCGKVDILMLFTQEILSLNLDIKNEKFKNLLQSNKVELKKALENIGYNTTIFFVKKEQNRYSQETIFDTTLDMDIKA